MGGYRDLSRRGIAFLSFIQNMAPRTKKALIGLAVCLACGLAILGYLAAYPSSHRTAADQPAIASRPTPKIVQTWVEEWDPQRQCWVRMDQPSAGCSSEVRRIPTNKIVAPSARFGPFQVLNSRVAALVGVTDADSLNQFARMMATYPDIDQLNFVDAPGTSDDVTNLKLGRIIRASGLATHIPANGSARSGAVDLFLAGVQRTMDKGARFAVHCWSDSLGRSPHDFSPHAPVNQIYLDYYMDMGMSHDQAHQFYDMTNSVPHEGAFWFGPEQMQVWLEATPDMAYLEKRDRSISRDTVPLGPGLESQRCPVPAAADFLE